MKLIDKDALVAEIERLKTIYKDDENIRHVAKYNILVDILSFIDTLEVKEVDLEKEIQRQYNVHKNSNNIAKNCVIMTKGGFEYFAKHFFELGINTSNPLTWEDIKLIWTIGDEIPYMPEEDFFKELLKRFKAQKGE